MKQAGSSRISFYHGNPQVALLLKLLAALVILASSRLLLYIFNSSLFPGLNLGTIGWYLLCGLRFDISALLYANILVIFLMLIPFKFRHNYGYQVFVNIIYVFSNAVLLIPNLADIIYFRFTMKRMTGDIFPYLKVGTDSNQFVQFFHDFWYIFLIWAIMIYLLIWVGRKINVSHESPIQGRTWYFTGQVLLILLFSGFTVLGMRGGLQLKPINILTASEYAEAQNTPLVLNSAFSIMQTLDQQGLEKKDYFKSESELIKQFNAEHNYSKHDSLGNPLPMKRMNVVIILLESFSREHIGYLNKNINGGKYEGFTPFLDSLSGHALSFNGFSNGKRSIEGIPAVLGGLPTWMTQDFITSLYASNKTNSLASLLRQEGYTSSFFHGGTNGTMGFNNYTRSAGFEHYFGRTEYGNDADFDGEWGIWDEQFLNYFARELNKMPQPFISSVFTLSSHHPYKVPEKYKGKFRKGALPIQQTIAYSDYALKQFFIAASKMPWYSNTLFVITADHTSEADLKEYKTRVGQYRIPILFFQPGSDLRGYDQEIMQQTDIMPSILDYLGYPKSFVAFGNSVFQKGVPRFDMSMISNSYQLVEGDYALQWNGASKFVLFNYVKDPLLTRQVETDERETAENMELLLKAIIQQYNNRMIENRLTSQ
jgi:phosphoglycerol transferase MdoB-like AlkP superfamily enzyme